MIGLLRSENLKIFTTKVWWGMLLGLFGAVAISLLVNGGVAVGDMDSSDPMWTEQSHAANLYTTGQYFGVLFAAILGALLMTNEYRHQTLTGTFLATPNRLKVISAKLVVIVTWGVVYALFTTAISVPVGMNILDIADADNYLSDPEVTKAIGLNLLAYAIWAVLGFGVGSMFRSQVGAIIVLVLGYLLSSWLLRLLLVITASLLDKPGVADVYWYLPNGATQVMTSAGEGLNLLGETDSSAPAWWVGTLFLLIYGAITAVFGVILTLKRDVA